MLCLTIPAGERLRIFVPPLPLGQAIEVHVRGTKGDRAKLAIDALPSIVITRPDHAPLTPPPRDDEPGD